MDKNKDFDFKSKYSELINKGISEKECSLEIPDKYRKQYIHTENGFVEQYCLYKDENNNLVNPEKYTLYGTMNLFNTFPDFIYPVFENSGKYYFLNSDNSVEIDSFCEIKGEKHISMIRPLNKSFNKLIKIKDYYVLGDEPIVAFQLNEDCIYIGDINIFNDFIKDKKCLYSQSLRQEIDDFQAQIESANQLKLKK